MSGKLDQISGKVKETAGEVFDGKSRRRIEKRQRRSGTFG